MPSVAFDSLRAGAAEVEDILRADPTPRGGLSPQPSITRALTRAALVMLCGHFERYVRDSIEEAVEIINATGVEPDQLPIKFKLLHAREGADRLSVTDWHRREQAITSFLESDGWLWADLPVSRLEGNRLLWNLKSPDPYRLMKLYEIWGVDDIFSRITRVNHMRDRFFSRLTELVQKRNNIAHGTYAVEATRGELTEYLRIVAEFCRRSDGVLAHVLRYQMKVPCSW